MKSTATQLSERLSAQAEALCHHYLSNGRRSGRYWIVGDVYNTPGRSLYVRLAGPTYGPGAAGKWTDAATGDHGDLLDLIRLNRQLDSLGETLAEARRFLGEAPPRPPSAPPPKRRNTRTAAIRLFAASSPIQGTLAERYLNHRGLRGPFPARALRYHPRCYYREHEDAPRQTWPALIAAVTDLAGTLTGVHRTWLDRDGHDKAPLVEPRRALGDLFGHAVRIGIPQRVLTAGEGLETLLSLRTLMPEMPVAAALSANHLAALVLPPRLARLYIAVDNDPAGEAAAETLKARAAAAGIEARLLIPGTEDWNSDLTGFGPKRTRDRLFPQLTPDDAGHFLGPAFLASALRL